MPRSFFHQLNSSKTSLGAPATSITTELAFNTLWKARYARRVWNSSVTIITRFQFFCFAYTKTSSASSKVEVAPPLREGNTCHQALSFIFLVTSWANSKFVISNSRNAEFLGFSSVTSRTGLYPWFQSRKHSGARVILPPERQIMASAPLVAVLILK